MPVFFIDSRQIVSKRIRFTGPGGRHFRALRYRVGDFVTCVDEKGVRYRTRVSEITPGRVTGDIVEVEETPPPMSLIIHLGFGIVKGERLDFLLQKCTEVGVAAFYPLLTERTVVRLQADRLFHQQERWRKIILEAAQQAGRREIPRIDPPRRFDLFLETPPPHDLALIFWEGEKGRRLREVIGHGQGEEKEILLLIGPEGGFSQDEVMQAEKRGFLPLSLGERVLRAETAAMVAVSLLQYELGDVG